MTETGSVIADNRADGLLFGDADGLSTGDLNGHPVHSEGDFSIV